MRVLGVIPARGGSKGVPGKNLRPLGGKPLIAWTAEAATGSSLSQVILSTDSEEIANVGRTLGLEVPFLRPGELATDEAKSLPVLQHALRFMEEQTGKFEAIMMLQPTTPFRTTVDIDQCVQLLHDHVCDSVISVEDVGAYHPARMKYVRDGFLIDPPFAEEVENQPRQQLEPMYIRNGAVYLTRRETLLDGSFKGRRSLAYLMPKFRSTNIDSEHDLIYAEWLAGIDADLSSRAGKL